MKKKGLIVFPVFLIVFIFMFVYMKNKQLSPPENENEAIERMIGTWTYTEPINSNIDSFPFKWVKWKVQSDGKVIVYEAHPTDDSWGEGKECSYEIRSGKFTDTGERWYGIRACDSFSTGVYEDGHIVLRTNSYQTTGKMQKGDRNPFSK